MLAVQDAVILRDDLRASIRTKVAFPGIWRFECLAFGRHVIDGREKDVDIVKPVIGRVVRYGQICGKQSHGQLQVSTTRAGGDKRGA